MCTTYCHPQSNVENNSVQHIACSPITGVGCIGHLPAARSSFAKYKLPNESHSLARSPLSLFLLSLPAPATRRPSARPCCRAPLARLLGTIFPRIFSGALCFRGFRIVCLGRQYRCGRKTSHAPREPSKQREQVRDLGSLCGAVLEGRAANRVIRLGLEEASGFRIRLGGRRGSRCV